MLKKLILLFVFALICNLTKAQEAIFPEGKYITFGVGIPFGYVKDGGNSPLWYKGTGQEFKIGFLKNTANICSRFDLVIGSLEAKPMLDPKPKFAYSGFSGQTIKLTYGLYKKVCSSSNQEILIGGVYDLSFNIRIYQSLSNNVLGYMVHTGLRAAAMNRASINSKWSYNTDVQVPILGIIARPNYLGLPSLSYAEKPSPKDALKNLTFATFNKYSAIDINVEANYKKRDWRYNRFYANYTFQQSPLPRPKGFKAYQYSLGYDMMFKR